MLHRNRTLSRNLDWKHFWSHEQQNICWSKISMDKQSMKKVGSKWKWWLFGKRIEKCKKKRRKMNACGLKRIFIQNWLIFIFMTKHGFRKILENYHILFENQKTFVLEFKMKFTNNKGNECGWNKNSLCKQGHNMVTCNRSLKDWFQKKNCLICKFTTTKHGKQRMIKNIVRVWNIVWCFQRIIE